jgi:hypothetical protein
MVDLQVTKLTWIPGDSAIADVTAPTATVLNGGTAVDLTCLMVSSYEVRPDGSDTTNERAVCEGANVDAPTVQNYMGNAVLFRQFDDTTGAPETDDPLNIFSFGDVGYFVRRLGKPYSTVYAASDVVEVYKFMADVPQPQGGTGEGYLKVTVPLLKQGVFSVKSIVA